MIFPSKHVKTTRLDHHAKDAALCAYCFATKRTSAAAEVKLLSLQWQLADGLASPAPQALSLSYARAGLGGVTPVRIKTRGRTIRSASSRSIGCVSGQSSPASAYLVLRGRTASRNPRRPWISSRAADRTSCAARQQADCKRLGAHPESLLSLACTDPIRSAVLVSGSHRKHFYLLLLPRS